METRIAGGNSKNRVRQRQEQAQARQAIRDKRTKSGQVRHLDAKLGKDLGAIKERLRLSASILEDLHGEVDKKVDRKKTNEKKTRTKPSNKEVKKRKKQKK